MSHSRGEVTATNIVPADVDAVRQELSDEFVLRGAASLPNIRFAAGAQGSPGGASEAAADATIVAAVDAYIGIARADTEPARVGAASRLPPELEHIFADARDSSLGGEVAQQAGVAGSFVRAARLVQAAYQRMSANADYAGSAATVAASTANVVVRNMAAVFVPTALRQFLSYGLEAAMQRGELSNATRTVLGAAAPTLAVAALAAGAVRDRMAGSQTPTSERSRAIMAATTAAAAVATVATGSMSRAAPLMLAFTAYTAMRDLLVQSRLRLENAHTENYTPDATHFALISVAYGIDQALVDLSMARLSSPSGSGAQLERAGIQVGNAFERAGLNLAGEVGEDLMYQGIEAVRSRLDPEREAHPLQLSIHDEGYRRDNVVDAALGPWAVRTGILSTTLGLTQMLTDHAKNPTLTQNRTVAAAASAAIVGIVNAVLYEPFANAGSAQPTGNFGEDTTSHAGNSERRGDAV